MSETIKNIKNFNIGDRVTSTHSILLDRGFRGVTGVIKTIVLDGRTWQYLIELDDGRELQCDDWHLKQPQLNNAQQVIMGELIKEIEYHLGYDMIEEGSMTAHDVLELVKNFKKEETE
ncbi:hypothetical protein [Enterococcus thailandicus]|uniref:hypothetical protein n=1 Tax=Enterococcus thailandicus TaxID=417368 RepID=UPI00244D8599|nr:hypothetical protein [Enterococcus thailandicus]GMC01802.1 hypothetical protein K2F_20620 [Enterococcus thailandicus]